MPEPVIRVENLSKRYRIGKKLPVRDGKQPAWSRMTAPIQNLSASWRKPGEDEIIWALKDVSFDVQQGEVLGLIGRNGAGKSTLLKILSRITEPTSGRAVINGRVGSLLEVGTGFHPELTGRENVYLNGAILGMKKFEIDRKFDEIVDFSGVEKFIDTPVKRYSSGMYVRLAFAVAAHLETEILLVDEVLAVGDAIFQQKCLGKMSAVATEGRTVLFVSHNMGAMNSLTSQCILMVDGKLFTAGITENVIRLYLEELFKNNSKSKSRVEIYHRENVINSPVKITRIMVNSVDYEIPIVDIGQSFTIMIELETSIELRGALVGLAVKKRDGVSVVTILSLDQDFHLDLPTGKHIVCCRVEDLPLSPGEYVLDVGINQSTGSIAWDVIQNFPFIRVMDRTNKFINWVERPWGTVHWDKVDWSIQ
jgi:lipopolysaccharide transport system ATP-binding protein